MEKAPKDKSLEAFNLHQRARQDLNLQPSDSKSAGRKPKVHKQQELTESSTQAGAPFGARAPSGSPCAKPAHDADLAVLVKAWPKLPAYIRQAILTLAGSITHSDGTEH
jgi:hypothetical protein